MYNCYGGVQRDEEAAQIQASHGVFRQSRQQQNYVAVLTEAIAQGRKMCGRFEDEIVNVLTPNPNAKCTLSSSPYEYP